MPMGCTQPYIACLGFGHAASATGPFELFPSSLTQEALRLYCQCVYLTGLIYQTLEALKF